MTFADCFLPFFDFWCELGKKLGFGLSPAAALGIATASSIYAFEVQGYLFSQPRPAADFDHLPFKVPSPAGLTQLARRDDAAPQRP
jgi:hypothetical protein